MAPVDWIRLDLLHPDPPRTESEINVNAKVCHAARMLIKANQAMIKLYNSQFYKWNSKQKVKKANSKLFSASSTRFCLFFATHDSIEVREFVGNEIQSGNWELLRGRARREGEREREGGSVSLNLALTLCDSWKFGIVMVLWSTHTHTYTHVYTNM